MLIGLSGFAQSGKDSVGAILVENHGFRRVAFADKLKEIAYALDPIVPIFGPSPDPIIYTRLSEIVDNWGWERSKANVEVRRLLQVIGTEVGRNILGDDVWVDLAFRDLGSDDVVVTDVRFPNEATRIRAEMGWLVRINRPGVGPLNEHASENALTDWSFDAFLDNDGTLEDLPKAVATLLGQMRPSEYQAYDPFGWGHD